MYFFLAVITFLHYGGVKGIQTYTMNCSKPINSEVVWNITLKNISISSMEKDDIIMQTKNYHDEDVYHNWNNLTNCTRNLRNNWYSIECEIDVNTIRMRYQLRLIRVGIGTSTNKDADGSYVVLVYPTSKGHYQDGLLCYPAHGIRNLRTTSVNSTNASIAWSFYAWDIPLVRNLEINVYENEGILMHFMLETGSHINQNQEHTIKGLKECRKYTVEVYYDYTFYETRTDYLYVNTTCPPQINRNTLNLSLLEQMIIALCSVILGLGLAFLYYFLNQARRHYRLQRAKQHDVIDLRDLMIQNPEA